MAAVGVIAALVALPADGHAQSRPPRACVEPKPIVAPARIGSKHFLYVEQETVTPQSDGRVLVAGNPVFLWGRLGKIWDVLPQDTLIGMIVSPPARVRALRSPIPGRSFSGVRSAALPDGWWLVTFAEVVAASAPVSPRVLSYWSAETDGVVWRSVQQLPVVSDSLNASESSALVLRDERAMLAVPAWRAGQHRVVLFTRERGAWRATNSYVGRYSYVGLAATASRDVLAVVGPVSTERDPVFSEDGPGLKLSWRVTSEDNRSRVAWFTRLNAAGDTISPTVYVATESELLYDAQRGRNGLWVASDMGMPHVTLRFTEYDGTSTPSAERVTATSYRGLLGLAITRDFAVLIASQTDTKPGDPAVISVIQSHPWRCH